MPLPERSPNSEQGGNDALPTAGGAMHQACRGPSFSLQNVFILSHSHRFEEYLESSNPSFCLAFTFR